MTQTRPEDVGARYRAIREQIAAQTAKMPKADANGYSVDNQWMGGAYNAPTDTPAAVPAAAARPPVEALVPGGYIAKPEPTLAEQAAHAMASGDVLAAIRFNSQMLVEMHEAQKGR